MIVFHMPWKIAEAKQRLSELLRQAADEPQEIANRERVVALVLGEKDMRDFLEWREAQRGESLAGALAEAQRICAEDGYVLPLEPRRDRLNAALQVNDVGRHKRRQ